MRANHPLPWCLRAESFAFEFIAGITESARLACLCFDISALHAVYSARRRLRVRGTPCSTRRIEHVAITDERNVRASQLQVPI
jgi:hypothetical protein